MESQSFARLSGLVAAVGSMITSWFLGIFIAPPLSRGWILAAEAGEVQILAAVFAAASLLTALAGALLRRARGGRDAAEWRLDWRAGLTLGTLSAIALGLLTTLNLQG